MVAKSEGDLPKPEGLSKNQHKNAPDLDGEPEEDTSSSSDLACLEEKIRQIVAPVVKDNAEGAVVNEVIGLFKAERFHGPLPHPKHFAAYGKIVPDAPERILTMAEHTLEHNIKSAEQSQYDDVKDHRIGMILGFMTLIALICAACFCAYIHEPVVACACFGAAVCGVLVKLFADTRKSEG